jgi:hypothetical protein
MINKNLILCAIGKHKYSKPLKDETLNQIVQICIHCGYKLVVSGDI